MKKPVIDNNVTFTIKDALRYSRVYQAVIESRSSFESENAENLKASYSIMRVLSMKVNALAELKRLIMEDANQLGRFKNLPDFVLSNYTTMDVILANESVLDLVSSGKVSYEGLVHLCMKGSL